MSIKSLCSNCPDDLTSNYYTYFNDSNFDILKDGQSVFSLLLNNLHIGLTTYNLNEFTIDPSDPLPAVPTIVPFVYNNMNSLEEVKLLVVVPEYLPLVEDWNKNLQWRFKGSAIWSNIGPFMFLTGSENDPSFIGNSNKISSIEFRNMSSSIIKVKILTAL